MSTPVEFVFILLAVIAFVLAAVPVPTRVNLVAVGLALYAFPYLWKLGEAL